jgi:hypothetical protein
MKITYKKRNVQMKKVKKREMERKFALAMLFCLAAGDSVLAQSTVDPSAALKTIKTSVSNVFAAAADIMYVVAALAGLIGAVLLYQKWNTGDPNTGKLVGSWIGSAIFVALAATFLKAMFKV